jgi:hypothetical protein
MVAVAVNCCVEFTLRLGLAGVTATEAIIGAVTVTVVVIGVRVPQVAVIVLEPAPLPSKVFEAPVVALKVTALRFEDVQVHAEKVEVVAAVPSVRVPLNCSVLFCPNANEKLVAENENELSAAGPTVMVMVPLTP